MTTTISTLRAGDVVDNPVTGERILFRRTAAETGGELVDIEVTVKAGGGVAAAHVHPYQTERFEVLEGMLEFRQGRRRLTAAPGDVVTVTPGTPHSFRNVGEGEARFSTEVRARPIIPSGTTIAASA